jgi:DNA-binding transcriptional LysR family regulator
MLKRADELVEKVRALARGEYGELHVGYASVPTAEMMPPAFAAFQKAVPRVKLFLNDSIFYRETAGGRRSLRRRRFVRALLSWRQRCPTAVPGKHRKT